MIETVFAITLNHVLVFLQNSWQFFIRNGLILRNYFRRYYFDFSLLFLRRWTLLESILVMLTVPLLINLDKSENLLFSFLLKISLLYFEYLTSLVPSEVNNWCRNKLSSFSFKLFLNKLISNKYQNSEMIFSSCGFLGIFWIFLV